MKAIVTGFEPFGGDTLNASWEAVKLIPSTVSGVEIEKFQLPVSFKRVREILTRLIEEKHPDLLLLTGQASGINSLHVERIAINIMDARIPDNDGYKPEDEPIYPEGPAAYFATIPLKKVVQAIRAAGVPAAVSNSAGTFVCNASMYTALHHVSVKNLKTRVGFIHVPANPQQALQGNLASMTPDLVARGIQACIYTCIGSVL